MERLQQDLATRDARLQELQQRCAAQHAQPARRICCAAGALPHRETAQRLQALAPCIRCEHSVHCCPPLAAMHTTPPLALLAVPSRHLRLEQGNTLEQQERADLVAAQAHFAALGWPEGSLEAGPGDAAEGCDAALAALLKRAAALQEACERGGPAPNWEQPEWRWGGWVGGGCWGGRGAGWLARLLGVPSQPGS